MTKNNANAKLIPIVIAAIVLLMTSSVGPFVSAQLANSPSERSIEQQQNEKVVFKLFDERKIIEETNRSLEQTGLNGKVSAEVQSKLDQNNQRLKEIETELKTLNEKSRELYTLNPSTEKKLRNAQDIIAKSNLNFLGSGVDSITGTLLVEVPHDDGRDYKTLVQKLIGTDIPLKVEITGPLILDACASQTSPCDPLIGGIRIAGQINPTQAADCTLSLPAVRNVFLGTETGFITAGHCYPVSTYDVRQPTMTSSVVGVVTSKVFGGNCDCEFVKKTGSRGLNSAVYSGPNTSTSITAKIDPVNGDWVVMTGSYSGVKLGRIIDPHYNPPGAPYTDAMRISSFESINGDSGAPITSMTNSFVYQGSVSGHLTGTTVMIPWNHIKSNLNLQ